jgi:hypothetical protein
MQVDSSHRREEPPLDLARRPITPVTIPATNDMNTTASAIQPRFTHPTSDTGVKYKATIAAGASAGRSICLIARTG